MTTLRNTKKFLNLNIFGLNSCFMNWSILRTQSPLVPNFYSVPGVTTHSGHCGSMAGDECAYCGFREGALDFRPKVRRSVKQRRSLTMTNRTSKDAEVSVNTTKSGGVKISDEVLTKLDSMEEDLEFLNKHLITEMKAAGEQTNTPKPQTPTPKPQTPTPKPQTPNPKPFNPPTTSILQPQRLLFMFLGVRKIFRLFMQSCRFFSFFLPTFQ